MQGGDAKRARYRVFCVVSLAHFVSNVKLSVLTGFWTHLRAILVIINANRTIPVQA